jgi:DNA-binding transcriptional LysR family regulator
MVAASTDLIACLPRRVAEALRQRLPLRMLELPVSGPKMPMGLVWHERTHLDQGVAFFRQVVVGALGGRRM